MKCFVVALTLAIAPAAHAQVLRELCPSRPGLNTPSCTVDRGHVLVEVGLGDWMAEVDGVRRRDEFDEGQVLVHLGVSDRAEVQLAWTAAGEVRTRDGDNVEHATSTGDVTIGFRRGLAGENGAVAIEGFFKIPTGGSAIGAGDYSGGVLLPITLPLNDKVTLSATPEVDWLPDSERDKHHVAYGTAVGMTLEAKKGFFGSIEGAIKRDTDPSGTATSTVASTSLAWQPGDNVQLDIGIVKGVSHAPDLELYFGISRRF